MGGGGMNWKDELKQEFVFLKSNPEILLVFVVWFFCVWAVL
jgi:hypothetical protein